MTFYEKFCEECGKLKKFPSVAMEEMGMNPSTLTGWKKGKAVPSDGALAIAAKYFGCEMGELAAARAESAALRSKENNKRKSRPSVLDGPKQLPLIGTVSCGAPVLAVENIEDMIPAPPVVRADFRRDRRRPYRGRGNAQAGLYLRGPRDPDAREPALQPDHPDGRGDESGDDPRQGRRRRKFPEY